jgi:hypothetical protein
MGFDLLRRYSLPIIVSSVVGLFVHVYLTSLINPIVSQEMRSHVIDTPPYGMLVNSLSFITALMPAIGVVLLYEFTSYRLPGKTRLLRGFVMGLLLLLVKGELLRAPIMNVMVGNPFWISALQQSEVWISNFSLAIVLSFLLPMPKRMGFD